MEYTNFRSIHTLYEIQLKWAQKLSNRCVTCVTLYKNAKPLVGPQRLPWNQFFSIKSTKNEHIAIFHIPYTWRPLGTTINGGFSGGRSGARPLDFFSEFESQHQ